MDYMMILSISVAIFGIAHLFQLLLPLFLSNWLNKPVNNVPWLILIPNKLFGPIRVLMGFLAKRIRIVVIAGNPGIGRMIAFAYSAKMEDPDLLLRCPRLLDRASLLLSDWTSSLGRVNWLLSWTVFQGAKFAFWQFWHSFDMSHMRAMMQEMVHDVVSQIVGKETNMAATTMTVSGLQSASLWYLDSGASNHMTFTSPYFHITKTIDTSSSTVRTTDNTTLKATCLGDIKSPLLHLSNVLLVLGLKMNLISISQLCDHGLKVSFTDSKCFI